VDAAIISYAQGGAVWTGTCSTGTNQSPINIATSVAAQVVYTKSLPALNVTYQPTISWKMLYTDNYLEIEDLNVTAGAGPLMAASLSGNGITLGPYGMTMAGTSAAGMYVPLNQFHFHSPSEHTIDGLHYPLEMHMVHKLFATPSNQSSTLVAAAVIGIMFMLDPLDANSTFVDQILTGPLANTTKLLSQRTTSSSDANANEQFDLINEVFAGRLTSYYAYNGSLTTPPCSEHINWHLLAKPMTISRTQLAAFLNALAVRQDSAGGTVNASASRGGDNRDIQAMTASRVVLTNVAAPTISAAPQAVAAASVLVAALLALLL